MATLKRTDYERSTKLHLLYTRLLLELATREKDNQYTPALLAAAKAQLNLAYGALIDELQAQLNVSPLPSRNLIEIARGLQTRDIHSTEVTQLLALEQDHTSWLAAMRRTAHGQIDEQAAPRQDPRLIGSSSQRQQQAEPYVWLDKMEELCRQMRAMMTEY